LPLGQLILSFSLRQLLFATVVIRVPLVHGQLVILLPFDGLSDVAPCDLDDEHLLIILDGFVVAHDQAEGFCEDFLERDYRDGLLDIDFQPLLLIVGLA
jgi:hypothetical protein